MDLCFFAVSTSCSWTSLVLEADVWLYLIVGSISLVSLCLRCHDLLIFSISALSWSLQDLLLNFIVL
jgi:hypothetical protein